MKIYITFIITSSIFFATGCVNLQQDKATPKEKKQIHITKLNKEVRELDTHDKRLIYKSIKHEIQRHRNKGDNDYKYEYYFDAINSYELVNFYEGYSAIPLKKISYMRERAKERSIKHYKIAKKHLTTNKKMALSELNIVMMNNPKYNQAGSELGVNAITSYQYLFDEKTQQYGDSPLHDWCSDGADALRQIGQAWTDNLKQKTRQPKPVQMKTKINPFA